MLAGLRRLAGDRAGGDRALRRAALVLAGAGGRARPALRGLLGDGAAAGRRGRLGDRRPGALGRRRSLYLCAVGSRARREALRAGLPVAAAGAARRLAALHRRRPLRHPRHQLQPRHVPAPAGDRPARRTARAPQLLHQGYPLGPALDRRRPQQGPGDRPRPGLRRPDDRRRRPRRR